MSNENKQFDITLDQSGVSSRKRTTKSNFKTNARVNQWKYTALAGEIGFAIALPMVVLTLVGKYLDKLWGSYPKLTLILLFIGVLLSVVNLVRTLTEINKRQ